MCRLRWIGTSFMRQIIPLYCSFVDSQLKIACDINVLVRFEEERISQTFLAIFSPAISLFDNCTRTCHAIWLAGRGRNTGGHLHSRAGAASYHTCNCDYIDCTWTSVFCTGLNLIDQYFLEWQSTATVHLRWSRFYQNIPGTIWERNWSLQETPSRETSIK